MKKRLICILFVFSLMGVVFTQENDSATNDDNNFSSIDSTDPSQLGIDSAVQRIKEVSIDKFENEGTWFTSMSYDEGFAECRLFTGNPLNKKPIDDEKGMERPDEKVLGVKVSFLRRGHNSFEVLAAKPLPVEGIAKTASVWTVGRSYPHVLKLIVEDFWGKRFELYSGKLNHSGWKLMTFVIPPQNTAGGNSGIVQKDYHYGTGMGLKIVGFKVECEPEDTYGKYYIYFDDLRVVSDLYEIDLRDKDDMYDNW